MSAVIELSTGLPVDAAAAASPEVDPLLQDLLDRIPPVSSTKTLAELIDMSAKTLERMREKHEGPLPTQLPGTTVWRYLRPDVVRWLLDGRGYPTLRGRLE